MTTEEKQNPSILKNMSSSRINLAKRANVQVVEVNKLLKMFDRLSEYFSKIGSFSDPQKMQQMMMNPSFQQQFMKTKTMRVLPGRQPTLFKK
jgi:signal recognition particle GTPase